MLLRFSAELVHKNCVHYSGLPDAQGLYDPSNEHDACGVGLVAHVKGRKSHAIVRQALQVLINLQHRGACGCEANTGDGAGILIQIPDRFFRAQAERLSFELPPAGRYGAGLIFLPRDPDRRQRVKAIFEQIVVEEGQRVLAWREVPTDNRALGASAIAVQPAFEQVVIGQGADVALAQDRFERKLYVIRKRVEHAVDALPSEDCQGFYVVSLSSQTLIYKGMLNAGQIDAMFPDLTDPTMESALALVHQRFSTNTFPSWPLAHPVPLRRAQRRDQHAARQHQLDEGARGAARNPICSATISPRSCRSSARVAATARSSTTSSSCW